MKLKSRETVLVQLTMTGHNRFDVDEDWRQGISGSKICPHCENIYEGVKSLDAITNCARRRTDLDLLGSFIGRVRVFSDHFIEVVGSEQISRVAGLGHITDVKGFEHKTHHTAVALRDTVIVRGRDPSTAGLCRECGRLLFGAAGDYYVLRSQIPPEPFFLSDGQVFCTDQFWKDHIYGAKLTRVAAIELPIREKPEDGLPESIKGIKAYLKSRKIFK